MTSTGFRAERAPAPTFKPDRGRKPPEPPGTKGQDGKGKEPILPNGNPFGPGGGGFNPPFGGGFGGVRPNGMGLPGFPGGMFPGGGGVLPGGNPFMPKQAPAPKPRNADDPEPPPKK